jgi:hypothetical protein
VLETDAYLALIHRGASPAYSKIRNDTFRTLATDPLFRRRVSEASLIRLLNAVAWKLHDAKEARAELMYLIGKGMNAELYAFPSVLTLCACTPPLPEVLRLWDFLFAYGSHLNILCIVAQLVKMRNAILSSPR